LHKNRIPKLKLDPEQDKRAHTQTTARITTTAFASSKTRGRT